jgi:hypothetical protein
MTAIGTDPLIAMLIRLKLTAIRDQLDSRLDEAARRKLTIREALSPIYRRRAATRNRSALIQRGFVSETKGSRTSRGETYKARLLLQSRVREEARGTAVTRVKTQRLASRQVSCLMSGATPMSRELEVRTPCSGVLAPGARGDKIRAAE